MRVAEGNLLCLLVGHDVWVCNHIWWLPEMKTMAHMLQIVSVLARPKAPFDSDV